MTIKKIQTVKATNQPHTGATSSSGGGADAPATGNKAGATIANRFKLDAPDPAQLKAATASKKSTQFALTAALLALAVAGLLTYILYQHWEFLMPV